MMNARLKNGSRTLAELIGGVAAGPSAAPARKPGGTAGAAGAVGRRFSSRAAATRVRC